MKIIDVGVCVNNNDPQGAGRIRYRPYGSFKSEIENAVEYEDWDENDQFIATPFLPPHINIIPQIRQSIKIIRYDTTKETQNVEYVTGPFTTPHDFGSETFTTQNKHTTYGGVIVKDLPAVRDEVTGEYIDKKSEGTLPKSGDNALQGNYGSDVIFSENGVMIRGGKLLSKRTADTKTRQKLQNIPLLSDNMSKIILKKFPKKMELITTTRNVESIAVDKINYVVEYELNSLSNPTEINCYVYKVIKNYGKKYDTDFFDETTQLLVDEVKLTNVDNTTTTPTAILSGATINALYSEIRGFLRTIHNKTLRKIVPTYPNEDIHPLYFRPTPDFRLLKPSNATEEATKANFLNQVKLMKAGPRKGLYFSTTSQSPPITSTEVEEKTVKVTNQTEEQTFASTTSDKIYLISSDANEGEKKNVDFTKLDKYEYTQDDFLSNIEPYTYALVRGETLMRLINLMYKFLTEHKHNLNDVPLYKPESKAQLEEMINTMETTLINQSIRIN